MTNLEALQRENELLKKKLKIARLWMSKEVKNKIEEIGKGNISENLEDTIQKQIESYFSDIILINLPEMVIQNIITSEINYHHMLDGENIGWSSVIIWYHKALDILIEKHITKDFRKFAKKHWSTERAINDPLEKSLHLVVTKWYSLSFGRLYHTLSIIQKNKPLTPYSLCFKNYLERHDSMKDILLSNSFMKDLSSLIKSEAMWKKRHIWSVSLEETQKVRTALIWDFKNDDSIIYSLIKTQSLEF